MLLDVELHYGDLLVGIQQGFEQSQLAEGSESLVFRGRHVAFLLSSLAAVVSVCYQYRSQRLRVGETPSAGTVTIHSPQSETLSLAH